MIHNYLKIALRNLTKNKLYTGVNLSGLAVGIASCILIGLYITHELSYDKFHTNADRIVRVVWEYNLGDAESSTALTGTKVGPEFTRRFPETDSYVRVLKYPRVISYEGKMFDEENFLYADSAFFSVFSYPLLAGDPKTVLDAPEKLVISESMAKKYFGSESPLGKTLKVGGIKDFLITGVSADAPENSQLKFDFVGSFTGLNASREEKWDEANYITFLLLKNKDNLVQLQSKIAAYMKTVNKEMNLQGTQFMRYHLEPLTKVHLHSKLDGFEPNTNIIYLYILSGIGLLILLIGCVNYTNLITAQSAGRSGEIGIRKVIGAGRKQIFFQFICESLILTWLAVVFGLLLASVLLPYFNELSGKNLQLSDFYRPGTIVSLFVLSVIVALVAGAYPALILSNGKLTSLLKSGFKFNGSRGLRSSLIVFQFVISIFLIISTTIITRQLSFIRSKDLGYNRDQVLVLPIDGKILEHYDAFKSEITGLPGVASVAAAYEEPIQIGWSDGVNSLEGNKHITVNALPTDEDIVQTLGLHIVAGRDFNRTDLLQFDTTDNGGNLSYSFMLNESAVRALGWTPAEAVGKTISKGVEGTIKAVVKDFHFRSLHEPISPLAIFLDKRMVKTMFIKLSGNNISGTLTNLEQVWKKRVTHRPFDYQFLDNNYSSLYKAEQRIGAVFTAFSTAAIVLACLGLFALTAFAIIKRTKEIGIRKVLGAKISDITWLISKEFLRLVFIAIIISSPVAWLAADKWLEGFSYRISIEWWVFVATGAGVLLIAFLTISFQAIKAATANPVKSLKTE